MAKGAPLTPEERADIVRLHEAGHKYKEIAAKVGRSYDAVYDTIKRGDRGAGPATKTTIARTARPDAKAKGDVPEAVLVDAYLAACEAERAAINGDRAVARERVLAALDRLVGRGST